MAPFDSQRVSLFYTFNLTISVVSLLPLSNTSSHSILSNCQIGRFLVGLVYTLVELMFIRTECHRVSSVKSQTKTHQKIHQTWLLITVQQVDSLFQTHVRGNFFSDQSVIKADSIVSCSVPMCNI